MKRLPGKLFRLVIAATAGLSVTLPTAAGARADEKPSVHLEVQAFLKAESLGVGAVLADGKHLVTLTAAGALVWRTDNWKLVKTIAGTAGDREVFAVDDRHIAVVGGDGRLSLVNVASDEIVAGGGTATPVQAFDAAPSKSRFLGCGNGSCVAYDASLRSIRPAFPAVRALFLDDDDALLLRAANGNAVFVSRNLASGKERQIDFKDCGGIFALSPDRKSLACFGGQGTKLLNVFDIKTAALRSRSAVVTKRYGLIAISNEGQVAGFESFDPSGKLFAYGNVAPRALDVFEPAPGRSMKLARTTVFREQASDIRFSASGDLSLFTFKGSAFILKRDGIVAAPFEQGLISFDNPFPNSVSTLTSRVPQAVLQKALTLPGDYAAYAPTLPYYSSDGKVIFLAARAGGPAKGVLAVDATTKTMIGQVPAGAAGLHASEDGRTALYCLSGHMTYQSFASGKSARLSDRIVSDADCASALTFSFGYLKDGKRFFVADAAGQQLKIFDQRDGSVVADLALDPGRRLTSVFGQRDGNEIAVTYRATSLTAANTVTVFDERGRHLREVRLEASRFVPLALHFADKDRLIVSDGSAVQGWDAGSGAGRFQALSFDKGEWVVVTPEGFFDASREGTKFLSLVRGLNAYSLTQTYQSLYRPDLVTAKIAGDPDGKVRDAAGKLDLVKVVDSGSEPKVGFATRDGEATTRTADVAIVATDAGGGIGKVEWRVNGVTQGIDEGGIGRNAVLDEDGNPAPSGRTAQLQRSLALEPGANRVEIVAYNAAGLIASDPVGITLTLKASQPATGPDTLAPRLFVLAVGINDYYDGRLNLAYAVPDAMALADGFRLAGQGLYSSVEATTLLNQDVTAAKIDAAFSGLAARMKPTDVFVFFIAGHGKTVDGHYHYIPYDFRYTDAQSILTGGIDQDRFQAWLSRIPARKSLMLADTCESGSLTGDRAQVASRGLERVEAQSAAIELLTRAVGRTVLSASTEDAPALEGYGGHGVFSFAILDALNRARASEEGLITVTSLAGYVDQRVQDVSYRAFHMRQIPQMRVLGSDFPVVHRLTTALVADDASASSSAISATTTSEDGSAQSEGLDGKMPTGPTHVVIAPTIVRSAASSTGIAVSDLPPGTLVTSIEAGGGWVLIAKGGKKLGFVPVAALANIQ